MRKSLLFYNLIILALFILPSCTRIVYFNTYRAAPINVPSHVKTLIVVDRTDWKDKRVNIIEGIITGETPGEDRNGVEEAIQSFIQTLDNSPRFKVKRASERLTGNTVTGTFPEPLTWNNISSICNKYEADAVVAIEIYDTDFIVTDGKRNVKKVVEKDGQKREIDVVEFYASGVGNCKIGFRIYDPKLKSIADQQMFNESNTWEGKGNSIRDAYAVLVQKNEANRFVSRRAGSSYAAKIAPMPIRISREFYKKPKNNQYMSAGVRQGNVGQWADAVETWKKGISFTNSKTAGKISYNVAVGYEVLGDLNSAKEWANKAYINYGNKKARDYSNTLNYRIRNEELVRQQLSNQ